jgi:hypothetical protein
MQMVQLVPQMTAWQINRKAFITAAVKAPLFIYDERGF